MKFRPCIDIHNGKVKQIVGGSLKDEGNMAKTNFASDLNAAFYANMYKEDCLRGGHIILLNSRQSEYYEQTKQQAKEALRVYPKGLQIGGGITDENAYEYIECCRKQGEDYYVVTDRWQKYTNLRLNAAVLEELSSYCDEFLIHGVDVEGKRSGMEEQLVHMLGQWGKIPITYAGGISSEDDLERFRSLGGGQLDFTIGSALDLFGGTVSYRKIVNKYN